jgi:hypothetical protein
VKEQDMRGLLAAVCVALMAAACGQQTGGKDVVTAAAEKLPDLFQSSYRVEAAVRNGERSMQLVMIRSGKKTRIEFAGPGGMPGAVVIDPVTGEALFFTIGGPRKVAMKMAMADLPKTPDAQWRGADTAKATGPCTHLGEVGVQWEVAATADAGVRRACITADGIILKTEEAGLVGWEATKITRGSQDEALFGVPEGYQVMDVGALQQKAAEMAKKFGQ